MNKEYITMFIITYNWTFFSLDLFIEVKLVFLPFNVLVTFESHFDTPSPVPVTLNAYPQNTQGEWNYII